MARLGYCHTELRTLLENSPETSTQVDEQWLGYVDHFCRQMKPVLQGIPEFSRSGVPDPPASIIEVLSCDNEMKQSEPFRSLYVALLHFRNHLQTESPLQQALLLLLWEIHANKPAEIHSMFLIGLRILKDVFPGADLPQTPDSSAKRMEVINFLVRTTNATAEPDVGMYRNHIQAEMSKLRADRNDQNPTVSRFFMRLMNIKLFPNDQFPMQFCLGECAKAATLKCLRSLPRRLTEFSATASEADHTDSNVRDQAELKPAIHILLGPPGCGKTHRMRKLLQHHWGFFLLPVTSPPGEPSSSNASSLCKPQFTGGSKDTQTWYADATSINATTPDCLKWAESRTHLLLACRFAILAAFVQHAHPPSPTLRLDWNSLQLTQDPQHDIFNTVFRIARFLDVRGLDFADTFNLPLAEDIVSRLPRRSGPFLICMDDAHRDTLTTVLGTRTNPFELLLSGLHSFLSWENISFRVALSATRVDGVVRSIKRQALSLEDAARYAWNRTSATGRVPQRGVVGWVVHTDFAMLESEGQFVDLLRRSGLVCDRKSRELVVRESEAFRGRYMWSVWFIQELKEQEVIDAEAIGRAREKTVRDVKRDVVEGLRGLERRALDEMAREARNLAVGSGAFVDDTVGLSARMDKVQEREMQYLETLDELCWLAVRSDLSGDASTFTTAGREDMVAQGLGLVQESPEWQESQRQKSSQKRKRGTHAEMDGDAELKVRPYVIKLKERIAVEAAIEYFQTCSLSDGASRYERALEHFLFTEQQAAGAFGKTAEALFAWRIRKTLRQPEPRADLLIPQNDDTNRPQLLQLLIGQAIGIADFTTVSKVARFSDSYEFGQHRLVEGNNLLYAEATKTTKFPAGLGRWMSDIRNGKRGGGLISTFWLPGETTEPDVLFALESPGVDGEGPQARNNVILCAVKFQRKWDTSHHPPIRSLNPLAWSSNSHDDSGHADRSMLDELREWELKRWPIVRLYITTSTEPPNDGSEVQQALADGMGIPNHQQFFNWLGTTQIRDLLGEVFLVLKP